MDFKKILLIACLFVGLSSFAQKRLEFNQVVTIDTNYIWQAPYGNWTHYTSYHYVPAAGKVWKIESSASNGYLQINDVDVAGRLYYAGSQSSQNVAVEPVSFPIWLKSGDKIRYRFSGSCTIAICPSTITHFISIIEFNIVTD
jgi:hypothetical protein